jgi:hypothetical protein
LPECNINAYAIDKINKLGRPAGRQNQPTIAQQPSTPQSVVAMPGIDLAAWI